MKQHLLMLSAFHTFHTGISLISASILVAASGLDAYKWNTSPGNMTSTATMDDFSSIESSLQHRSTRKLQLTQVVNWWTPWQVGALGSCVGLERVCSEGSWISAMTIFVGEYSLNQISEVKCSNGSHVTSLSCCDGEARGHTTAQLFFPTGFSAVTTYRSLIGVSRINGMCFLDVTRASQCVGKQYQRHTYTTCGGARRVVGFQAISGSSVSSIRFRCQGSSTGGAFRERIDNNVPKAAQSVKVVNLRGHGAKPNIVDSQLQASQLMFDDVWTVWHGGLGGCEGDAKICPPGTFLDTLPVYAGAAVIDSFPNVVCRSSSMVALLTNGDGETTYEEIVQENVRLYELPSCLLLYGGCSNFYTTGDEFIEGLCVNWHCLGRIPSVMVATGCPPGQVFAGLQTRHSDQLIALRFLCRTRILLLRSEKHNETASKKVVHVNSAR